MGRDEQMSQLKDAWSYFSKLIFLFKNFSLQSIFKISVEIVIPFGCTKKFCILQLPISYCVSLIMVTITRHIFIHIFQQQYLSTVKFAISYQKNELFVISKFPKIKRKVGKNQTGLL